MEGSVAQCFGVAHRQWQPDWTHLSINTECKINAKTFILQHQYGANTSTRISVAPLTVNVALFLKPKPENRLQSAGLEKL